MLRVSIISVSAASAVSNFLALILQTIAGSTPSILLLIILVASITTLLIAIFAWEKVGIDQDYTPPNKEKVIRLDNPNDVKRVILGRETGNKIPDSLPHRR